MPLFIGKKNKKTRKFPFRIDSNGLSARKRAFLLFDQGRRPAQIKEELGITLRTSCRYFADWKKQPANKDKNYRILKKSKQKNPKYMSEIASSLSIYLSIPKITILRELEKPWALKRIVDGTFLAQANKMHLKRLANAVKFLELYETLGVPFEKIEAILDKLEEEAKQHRL